MKGLANIIGNVITSRLGLSTTRRGYPITLQKPSFDNRTMLRSRRAGVATITTRRRRRNKANNAGIEINKADGGYKSIVRTGAVRHLAINEYARMYLDKAGSSYEYKFYLKSDGYASGSGSINITSLINNSSEFNDWCTAATQYKVYGVRFSFDYTRVPEAGDAMARLLMSVQTDKCNVIEPDIERNVMNLDMSRNGVKNFNFNLNNRNTEVDNLGWHDTADYFGARCILRVVGQDLTFLKDTSQLQVFLGTIKISIMAKVRLRDYISNSAKQKPDVLYRKKMTIYLTAGGIVDENGEKLKLELTKHQEDKKDEGQDEEEEKKEAKDEDENSQYDGDEEFITNLEKQGGQ